MQLTILNIRAQAWFFQGQHIVNSAYTTQQLGSNLTALGTSAGWIINSQITAHAVFQGSVSCTIDYMVNGIRKQTTANAYVNQNNYLSFTGSGTL